MQRNTNRRPSILPTDYWDGCSRLWFFGDLNHYFRLGVSVLRMISPINLSTKEWNLFRKNMRTENWSKWCFIRDLNVQATVQPWSIEIFSESLAIQIIAQVQVLFGILSRQDNAKLQRVILESHPWPEWFWILPPKLYILYSEDNCNPSETPGYSLRHINTS